MCEYLKAQDLCSSSSRIPQAYAYATAPVPVSFYPRANSTWLDSLAPDDSGTVWVALYFPRILHNFQELCISPETDFERFKRTLNLGLSLVLFEKLAKKTNLVNKEACLIGYILKVPSRNPTPSSRNLSTEEMQPLS